MSDPLHAKKIASGLRPVGLSVPTLKKVPLPTAVVVPVLGSAAHARPLLLYGYLCKGKMVKEQRATKVASQDEPRGSCCECWAN
jgi:hypothetical protein